MNKSNFEKVSVILGPCDLPHMYELFEGYLIKDRYVMMIDNSVLTLRHVKRKGIIRIYMLMVTREESLLQDMYNVKT